MFHRTTGPMNLNGIHGGCVADPEVRPLIVGRLIAAAAKYICSLTKAVRRQIDRGAHSVPRTLWAANQLQPNPMMMVWANIPHQRRHVIHRVDDDICLTVVE